MYNQDENPGGSLSASGKSIGEYLKEYKKQGNHVKRYNFARKFVSGKKVVELGCGFGAGGVLLDKYVTSYTGIDIDEEAIKYANTHVAPLCNKATYELLSESYNHIDDIQADVAICYEVIEHVNDPEKLLTMLKRMVKQDGKIILSTPNGLSSLGNKSLFRSPFHVNEFSPKELYELCSKFGKVMFFGEKRIDRMDVKSLQGRLSEYNNPVTKSTEEIATVSLGRSKLFDFAINHFNGKIFWEIYPSTYEVEQKYLRSSTLLAIIL
ncbi:MAG: class I SAM-dependent methyltransferase [Thermoplasmataceae archaeon]